MLLIQNAEVYAPRALGLHSLLIGGGKILWMGLGRDLPALPAALQARTEAIDLDGARLIPGLIDGHTHLTGGGGEDGFPLACATVAADAIHAVGCDDGDRIARHR